MTTIINSYIPEFKVNAYHNGEFKTITDKDVKGKWGVFFFYPADFTFVCPTGAFQIVAITYLTFSNLK